MLQCSNGHLMCAGCFTHLLADARIRDETATCPNCRVEITRSIATRNLGEVLSYLSPLVLRYIIFKNLYHLIFLSVTLLDLYPKFFHRTFRKN